MKEWQLLRDRREVVSYFFTWELEKEDVLSCVQATFLLLCCVGENGSIVYRALTFSFSPCPFKAWKDEATSSLLTKAWWLAEGCWESWFPSQVT